jgi:hypothetical protein
MPSENVANPANCQLVLTGSNTGYTDMLGFDIPDSAGKILYLELQAENFGGTGKIRFEIPVSRIKNW